jgi:hypothetical protein
MSDSFSRERSEGRNPSALGGNETSKEVYLHIAELTDGPAGRRKPFLRDPALDFPKCFV